LPYRFFVYGTKITGLPITFGKKVTETEKEGDEAEKRAMKKTQSEKIYSTKFSFYYYILVLITCLRE
jgi:hypothetical protein